MSLIFIIPLSEPKDDQKDCCLKQSFFYLPKQYTGIKQNGQRILVRVMKWDTILFINLLKSMQEEDGPGSGFL